MDGENAKGRRAADARAVTTSTADPFMSLRVLSEYSGISRSGLLRAVKASPERALPCYVIGRKILVRRSEFDRWAEGYRTRGRPKVAKALARMGLAHL
jgi:Helix-turn-helix domain